MEAPIDSKCTFRPVRGRYLTIYSNSDTILVICELEIYGTLSEWPGKCHIRVLRHITNNINDHVTELLKLVCKWLIIVVDRLHDVAQGREAHQSSTGLMLFLVNVDLS